MKNNIIAIICLICILGCSSQNKSPLIPKKGNLIFKQEINIINQSLIDSTLKSAEAKIMEGAAYTMGKSGQKQTMDSMDYASSVSLLQNMIMGTITNNFTPNLQKKWKEERSFRFQDSIIISKEKNTLRNLKHAVIHRGKETVTIKTLADTTKNKAKNIPYKYVPEDNLKVSEFRNETKEINGYECFKIVTTSQDIIKNANNLEINYTHTLYVTEELQCKYHPVFKYRSILKKYYPLEITETNDLVKGYEKIYSIKEMKLE
ncbi:hypothetical protein [Aquimarina macrocephali]|uniref:hypothetical protein n=1 Tax=Aquimarina macrocephali TaxID=666563 RepID=UPI0012689AD7|nr:hypothetical protein [Aquimarina macrocephali]